MVGVLPTQGIGRSALAQYPRTAKPHFHVVHPRGITKLKFFGIQIGDLFLEVQRIAEVLRSNSAADDPESDGLRRQIEHARQLLAERM